jgi:aspartate dehydrogenase
MPAIRVAVAGLGAIGRVVARRLASGMAGFELTAVSAKDEGKAREWLASEKIKCPVAALPDLSRYADVAVECAPAAFLEQVCRPMLEAGKKVIVVSAAGLIRNHDLIELAAARGGQIIVPTGALVGLDAVTAAAEGKIRSVRLTTRKPPASLAGAPYLEQHGVSLEGITEPRRVFAGSAREAATGFPANMNVAAALALAGIGPERTTVEIWADPGVSRNCHTIDVDSDSAHFTMAIQNIPSENAKTGRITALSVLAALKKLNAPVRIGT